MGREVSSNKLLIIRTNSCRNVVGAIVVSSVLPFTHIMYPIDATCHIPVPTLHAPYRSVESISERPPPHILHIFNSKCEQIYSSAGDLQGSFMSLSSSATASSPPLTMMILNDIYLPLPAWPSSTTHHHHPDRPYFIACTLSSSSVSLPYK